MTHEEFFRAFLSGAELRTSAPAFLAGNNTINFTDPASGGVLVPQQMQAAVTVGMAQVDDIFRCADVVQEKDFTLRPLTWPGYDLSTIKATRVDESAQHTPDAVPPASAKITNSWTYRVNLLASLEYEQDAQDRAMAAIGAAAGAGIARGAGEDLVKGNGVDGPSGIINGLTAAFTTNAAGVVTATDIDGAYFAVNRVYRAAKGAGWLMNDAAYKLVRAAKDSSNRPLLDKTEDGEKLMGKPIYFCPGLPTSGAGSFCVFGDLTAFKIHCSTLLLRRSLQAAGAIENGMALFTGLMRVDSVLLDASGGANPPVVACALHA